MWELLKYFEMEGYMLSFSTFGEERWTKEVSRHEKEEKLDVLPLGQGFAILDVKDFGDNTRLLKMRSPL